MANELKADRREDAGKGVARKLRAAGRVPGVLYGHGEATIPLSIDERDLKHVLHTAAGSNVLIDLVVDGKKHLALPREIQRDHIHARLIHVDLLAVRRDEKITVNVEVTDVGEAVGVKAGGVVEHHLRELHVECLPQNVPDRIEVDVSALEIGDMIHVRDVVPPEGVTILTNPEDAVLSVITPAALRVEAELLLPGEEAPEAAPEEEAPEAAEGEGEGEGEAPAPAAEEGGEG
jgi:large subunit ribosomal protein L25